MLTVMGFSAYIWLALILTSSATGAATRSYSPVALMPSAFAAMLMALDGCTFALQSAVFAALSVALFATGKYILKGKKK